MLRSPYIMKIVFRMPFIFWATSIVYYGLGYGAANLPGKLHINNFINGLVEISGLVLLGIAMSHFGRRMITSSLILTGGVTCGLSGILFLSFFGSAGEEVGRWLSFIGMLLVSATFGIIWVYIGELYPTSVRSIGTSTGSMAARIGAIMAPYIIMIGTFSMV